MAKDESSTHDPETWMWERARAMLERADRLQRTFFQPRKPGGRRPSWEPPVDVFETPEELWVLVALPGVDAEHVALEVDGPCVRVRGQRLLPEPLRRANVHRMEIPYGLFERVVELPPGRYELQQSQLSQGCLVFRLLKIV